jgi:hypothetical protein
MNVKLGDPKSYILHRLCNVWKMLVKTLYYMLFILAIDIVGMVYPWHSTMEPQSNGKRVVRV